MANLAQLENGKIILPKFMSNLSLVYVSYSKYIMFDSQIYLLFYEVDTSKVEKCFFSQNNTASTRSNEVAKEEARTYLLKFKVLAVMHLVVTYHVL